MNIKQLSLIGVMSASILLSACNKNEPATEQAPAQTQAPAQVSAPTEPSQATPAQSPQNTTQAVAPSANPDTKASFVKNVFETSLQSDQSFYDNVTTSFGQALDDGSSNGCLDYSPVIGGQDIDEQLALSTVQYQSTGDNDITISYFNNPIDQQDNKPTKLTYHLVCENDKCLIDDVSIFEEGTAWKVKDDLAQCSKG